jgi:hypothetical protein
VRSWAEARALRDELAEFAEAVEPPDPEKRRVRGFHSPFVFLDASVSGLGQEDRDNLNDLEEGLDQVELEQAVADLRLLLDAYLRCANSEVRLLIDAFEISDYPYDEEDEGPRTEDGDSATGKSVLDCVRSDSPALSEIVELLDCSDGQSDVLATRAKTAVGEALAGTAFIVTKRYED